MTDPAKAVMFIAEHMLQWNLQWLETVKQNMHFYHDIQFDNCQDMLRIKAQIQELKI